MEHENGLAILPPPPEDELQQEMKEFLNEEVSNDNASQVEDSPIPPEIGERRIYTKSDFLDTKEPYAHVYSCRKDPFLHQGEIERMAINAKSVGFVGFKKMYEKYFKTREKMDSGVGFKNQTDFTNQALELDSGEWDARDSGISKYGGFGEEIACVHPIMPIERLVNIDTGTEKLKLAYRKGGIASPWRTLIVEKSILASPQKILALADQGIAVTSETAKMLISYLHDIENLNYDRIPEKKAITRLGYMPGEGFSPYVPNLVFDGDLKYRHIFNSVRPEGSREEWLNMALSIRRDTVAARVVLAAAFASALVEPCGSLPFFVHLWGGESGTGKTVAVMVAASVWGDPERGQYTQTFNSTEVGFEMMATFLNHLPLIIDELQLARDSKGNAKFNVYKLAEGVGKTRSNKSLGLNKTPTWANCIITNGESPLVSDSVGAGAVNRVIEIECQTGESVIPDGPTTAATVKRNFGFAGQEFVETLYGNKGFKEAAVEIYTQYFKELSQSNTTEKQAMAAAVLLTGDELATQWIFKDGRALTSPELAQFLATKASVSAGDRGYRYMCDWVSMCINRFERPSMTGTGDAKTSGDIYGVIEDESDGSQIAYINNSVFRDAADNAGYNSKALLSYLKSNNLILTRGKNMTRGRRIKGTNTECIALKIGVDGEGFVEILEDDLPGQLPL